MADLFNRYFVYSPEQKKDKMAIAKRAGNVYTPGSVIIKGRQKQFTDIVNDMHNCKYGDATIVCQGDIRRIEYTPPKQ